MKDVYVIGVGMTRFGKFPDRNMKSLAAEATEKALAHAGVEKKNLGAAYVGNSVEGLYNGQESIRGQVVLRPMGIDTIPVFNVENACASSSSALHLAWMDVASGMHDIALVLGMEKMYLEDKEKRLKLFLGGMDVEVVEEFMKLAESARDSTAEGAGKKEKQDKKKTRGTVFMDAYAMGARYHIEKYGSTQRQLAAISAKNHNHSAHNPYSQYQKAMSIEEVLAAPEVSYPLTVPMCAPIGDGSAAAIVASGSVVKKLGCPKPVQIMATSVGSGRDRGYDEPDIAELVARKAYETAGVGPEDIDVVEVHDATAYGELSAIESIGLCPAGEGGAFSEAGHTTIGGKIPVNPSGGLECKGHPVGATGVAQVAELVWQLRREAGKRQVEGARIALAENGGGIIGIDGAAMCITILKAAF